MLLFFIEAYDISNVMKLMYSIAILMLLFILFPTPHLSILLILTSIYFSFAFLYIQYSILEELNVTFPYFFSFLL